MPRRTRGWKRREETARNCGLNSSSSCQRIIRYCLKDSYLIDGETYIPKLELNIYGTLSLVQNIENKRFSILNLPSETVESLPDEITGYMGRDGSDIIILPTDSHLTYFMVMAGGWMSYELLSFKDKIENIGQLEDKKFNLFANEKIYITTSNLEVIKEIKIKDHSNVLSVIETHLDDRFIVDYKTEFLVEGRTALIDENSNEVKIHTEFPIIRIIPSGDGFLCSLEDDYYWESDCDQIFKKIDKNGKFIQT